MAVGSAVIDFGAYPGSNEASVTITGQAAILSTNSAEAWLMAESQDVHTVNDATYAALLTSVSCGIPTAASGFTIYARSTEKLQGQFKVRWVWA